MSTKPSSSELPIHGDAIADALNKLTSLKYISTHSGNAHSQKPVITKQTDGQLLVQLESDVYSSKLPSISSAVKYLREADLEVTITPLFATYDSEPLRGYTHANTYPLPEPYPLPLPGKDPNEGRTIQIGRTAENVAPKDNVLRQPSAKRFEFIIPDTQESVDLLNKIYQSALKKTQSNLIAAGVEKALQLADIAAGVNHNTDAAKKRIAEPEVEKALDGLVDAINTPSLGIAVATPATDTPSHTAIAAGGGNEGTIKQAPRREMV